METSKLHVYSIGIVAVNKPLDTDIVEVTPIEALPMLNGEITDNIQTVTSDGKDSFGSAYSTSVDSTVTVKAKWLPIGITNRKTSPDVRRGEYVVLYRFGDQDKFYWTTLIYDMKLRKLETVIYAFSDTKDEAAEGTSDNTYYLEVSTHRGVVTFHTSKSNGEPFKYDFQINAKDGNFIFQDDIGNFISVDSTNSRVELMNSSGSHVDMDKEIITITAPDTINLIAQKGNINMSAGTDINSVAGNTMSDKAQTILTQSNSTTNTVPTTTFTGDAIVIGMTTTTGLSSVAGGSFTVAGPGQFQQPVQFTSIHSSGEITSDSAVHAPNIH